MKDLHPHGEPCELMLTDEGRCRWCRDQDDLAAYKALCARLAEALREAIKVAEAHIHDEYDGTTMLAELLEQLDESRAALAEYDAIGEKRWLREAAK